MTLDEIQHLPHLNYESFEQPVIFKIGCPEEQTILPVIEIEFNILEGNYGLSDGLSFDMAADGLAPDEEIVYEIAFDAAISGGADKVLEDVRTLLENYNTPPPELTEEEKEQWRSEPVKITAIEKDPASIAAE